MLRLRKREGLLRVPGLVSLRATTPLAGSSAGAIVCAVIASGASMQESLNATKILAEDYRARGTAFRLVVRVCAFPASRLGLEEIGISPDCNTENRARPRGLFSWALEPAEDHVLYKLFELGYLDAAVWAEENLVDKTVEDEAASVENGSATLLACLPDDLTQVLC